MRLDLSRLHHHRDRIAKRSGFTLTELLVVILIIVILSAATLPAVLPALNSRRVSEAARLIQSELARARGDAVRSNSPRGFRLIPDPESPPGTLTSSRLVSLEVPPDYSEGKLYLGQGFVYGPLPGVQAPNGTITTARIQDTYLRVVEQKFVTDPVLGLLPANPTSWYWNLRQGDKLRISDSGQTYTVVGPVVINGPANPERFINAGHPNDGVYPTGPGNLNPEVLWLLNGTDDDNDGFVDEAFDGVDNDNDGIIDPGFNNIDDDGVNGIDDVAEAFLHRLPNGSFTYPGYTNPLPPNASVANEFEYERFVGRSPTISDTGPTPPPPALEYTVKRRPTPTASSREIALPTNVVVDMTTWATGQPERSRLPVDPKTGNVDILVAPNGQILASGAGSSLAPPVYLPFYHFWLTERDDVFEPFDPSLGLPFKLPMPRNTGYDTRIAGGSVYDPSLPTLKAERRLVSVNTRTGQITSTAVEVFYTNNPSYPFEAAESGVRDAQP